MEGMTQEETWALRHEAPPKGNGKTCRIFLILYYFEEEYLL